MPAADDWMKPAAGQSFFPGAQPPPAQAAVEKIPLDVALNARDGAGYAAANPILAAAAPLLILLGRLRLMIVDMQAVPLMNHVANEIREFERKVLEAGVPREDAMVAKYALCGTADDIVQNLPGADRQIWLQYSMLAQFFQVRTSGVGFFEELNKILANPAPRYNLLEFMHACLSLGFEGRYRGVAGGDRDLQRVRREVYETLRHVKARSDEDISPRWRGMAKSMANMATQIPVWAVASFAGAALVGVYFLLRLIISNDGEALAGKLLALNPSEPITIERAAVVAPFEGPDFSDTTQLERIRGVLADEIAGGSMAVEKKGEFIVVEINNLLLFDSGKADVKPEFEAVAERIAAALDPEPGPINIIGHTDSVKLRRTSAFKSNYELSLARARSVEKMLAPKITEPARITVEGKGEDEPIADNGTAEGRARNRRVDVMIPAEETLTAGQPIIVRPQ
ncbi:type VI secretion system protein TssL, long form [Chelativorans sp. AA-79]|uniref:type VI secretion system protein TssL, long form n=1 Tax=Chelativorans sp. AA-79 TaxID=3028735 RepID=UPI0023F94A30|nr:type VI secretion system protein TssL, long form [Chelativorans sp. AA-79]WEX10853.1 type VI secretion system protein TssL, long form [Chelativorans sp. AA-79]